MNYPQISRRHLVRRGLGGAALGIASLSLPMVVRADASDSGPESVQVVEILQLQAAFHKAKRTQDIELMMSLWAPDALFNNVGTLLSGADQIRAFFVSSGSFTHHRISFVPSFKEQVRVHGDD